MLRAVWRDEKPSVEASVNGVPIYLDNFAISKLAKGDSLLRRRFVSALHDGAADLLFSVAHAVEIAGAQGDSSTCIRSFLDELGPHWCPIELVPAVVMRREAEGWPPGKSCFAEDLLKAFYSNRASDNARGSGKVINLSEQFFRLGAFVDWLAPQRDHLMTRTRQLDAEMNRGIGQLRAKSKKIPGWLDSVLPAPQFDPNKPATFAHNCLMRELILDRGYQLKKGDGLDFCHAVIASSFAIFATLDKQWKRRVENFPKPNSGSRIYYEPELGTMMADIESALAYLKSVGAAPVGLTSP